jgi:AraC-like DNA-binding protein
MKIGDIEVSPCICGEIAYHFAFKYAQHFIRLFKQRVGHTPQAYRLLHDEAQKD